MSIFFFWILFIREIKSNNVAIKRLQLMVVGQSLVRYLDVEDMHPRSDAPLLVDSFGTQTNRWHNLLNLEAILNVYSMLSVNGSKTNLPQRLYNAKIWTVIENIPDDPPSDLIVLATRNVDPMSLRTKLTSEDMHKQIRFLNWENIPELQKYSELKHHAILINAAGVGKMIPIDSKDSKEAEFAKYEYIYKGIPFDLTTKLVDGLPVKYLTSDGEFIPDND